MELFIARHSEFLKYYNCSYDIDTVPMDARVHKTHGILMIALSSLFVAIYIPTLSVLCKQLHKTAYQLMFVIGVADVLMLAFVAVPYGVMSITGDVFCSYPTLLYFIASVSMGLWVSSTETGVVLAFYRCLELWRPFVADALFKGKRTFVWIGLGLLHFCAVVAFGTPIVYNPIVGTMLLNPHFGYVDDAEGAFYNWHHKYYNMGLLFVLLALYACFVYLIVSKRRMGIGGGSAEMQAAQRRTFIQAMLISSCGAVSDAYWAIVFLGPSPPQVLIFIGMYTWICCHGMPGVILITINRTVRSSLGKIFGTHSRTAVSHVDSSKIEKSHSRNRSAVTPSHDDSHMAI
ncbi:SRT-29 protein [Aphelenchoides avenae]|nr:SRT-29 protein [Aphelenchus avenae]